MRSILTMAVKDVVLVTRDWLGLFFIIGFPILMGVFFGSMYGDIGGGGSAQLRVAVVDQDDSPMSQKFVAALDEADGVEVDRLSRDEAMNKVRRGELAGMIAVPKGFGETAGIPWEEGPEIELGVDPSRQAEGGMIQGIVMQAAGKLVMERMRDPAAMRPQIQEALAQINDAEEVPAEMRPLLQTMLTALDGFMGQWQRVVEAERTDGEAAEGDNNAEADGGFQIARIKTIDVTHEPAPGSTEALVAQLRSKWDISFPQGMIWGILACAATFAITMVRERKQGTLLRLQAAPLPRSSILLGKALACFFAVIAVIAVMAALGAWLGMRPRNPALLALAAVCVAIAFVGITILMSVIGKTEEAVGGAAWGANMIMAMLGGGMVPLAFMPKFLVPLSQVSPVKWSVLALEGAIWRGFTFGEMLLPCAILLAVGAVCLALGSVRLARMTE
jgi:ABC-2 type transport system permease protein